MPTRTSETHEPAIERKQERPKAKAEEHAKGADQRGLDERYGQPADDAEDKTARESGYKGASNVGEDETSGSE